MDVSVDLERSPPADASGDSPPASSRYQRIRQWPSRFLPGSRDLFVYLPQAYLAEPERRFPVLLLHDGQNLFDGDLSYIKGSTWRAGTTADTAIAEGSVEPLILVGIANTGVERMAEYTPTRDGHLGGGRGPLYAQLLVEDLLPMLHIRYRLLAGPANAAIAGSSLGGLISLWTALQYPHIFGKAGVLSPSLWWNSRSILNDVASLRHKPDLRLWLDMGSAEGAPHVRDACALARLLERKGWSEGEDLQFQIIPGGVHSEEAWAARFGDVLRFLFPGR